MTPLLLNSISLMALFFVSIWLLYLNHRILQVTKDIYYLTQHIDQVSVELVVLTGQMVTNLSMPEPVLKDVKALGPLRLTTSPRLR